MCAASPHQASYENPLGPLKFGLSSRDRFHVLRIHQNDCPSLFQQIEDRTPKHTTPNVTKHVLNWEYTVEILRSDLRARLRDRLHTSPPRSVISHEGSYPQDPGAPYVQGTLLSASAVFREHHV